MIASIRSTNAKILDVKSKTISPKNKSFFVKHSILPLTWQMDTSTALTNGDKSLSWDQDNEGEPKENIIYRSFLPQVGYGRFNPSLLEVPKLKLADLTTSGFKQSYYAVSALNCNGESAFSNTLELPDSIAFMPYFKGCTWIDPYNISTSLHDGSFDAPFSSLLEAIDKQGKDQTFIVKRNRSGESSLQNVMQGTEILYLDDIAFIGEKAEVTLTLLDGLDKDGCVELYFLFKALGDSGPGFNAVLQGAPEIKFINTTKKVLKRPTGSQPSEPGKALTPRLSLRLSK